MDDSESIECACDPLILPGYGINPHAEDRMSEEGYQHKVYDFEVCRLVATAVGESAWGIQYTLRAYWSVVYLSDHEAGGNSHEELSCTDSSFDHSQVMIQIKKGTGRYLV